MGSSGEQCGAEKRVLGSVARHGLLACPGVQTLPCEVFWLNLSLESQLLFSGLTELQG